MSGIDDLLAQPNDGWAHAMRRAQGIEDKGLGEAVKIYYTRYFPVGLVVLVATGTFAGVLGFGGALSDWASYLIFGIFLAAFGVVIGGLMYNSKKVVPAARVGRVDVLLSLESEERKQIRRQIAGKSAVDPEHLFVARAAAVQLRKGTQGPCHATSPGAIYCVCLYASGGGPCHARGPFLVAYGDWSRCRDARDGASPPGLSAGGSVLGKRVERFGPR